jgi:hypothetical protein
VAHSTAPHTTARQKIGAYGAHLSWANTPDRTRRTRNGRAASPGELAWHLARLDPVKFAKATEAQRLAAAEAARRAYFAKLSLLGAKAKARTRNA